MREVFNWAWMSGEVFDLGLQAERQEQGVLARECLTWALETEERSRLSEEQYHELVGPDEAYHWQVNCEVLNVVRRAVARRRQELHAERVGNVSLVVRMEGRVNQ